MKKQKKLKLEITITHDDIYDEWYAKCNKIIDHKVVGTNKRHCISELLHCLSEEVFCLDKKTLHSYFTKSKCQTSNRWSMLEEKTLFGIFKVHSLSGNINWINVSEALTSNTGIYRSASACRRKAYRLTWGY